LASELVVFGRRDACVGCLKQQHSLDTEHRFIIREYNFVYRRL
jgi:hypothetical protein